MWGTLVSLGGKIGLRTVVRETSRHGAPKLVSKWAIPAVSSSTLYGGAKLAGKGIKTLAIPAAMIFSAGMLGHWADTNVQQTKQISEDTADRLDYQWASLDYQQANLDWQKQKWQEEMDAKEDDENLSLFQTGLIEAYDQKNRNFQASMQAQSQNFEAQLYMMKQAQLMQDRDTYLANQAFQTFTGGRQSAKDDQYTIAFILSELMNMNNKSQPQNEVEIDNYFEQEYDEFDSFDDYQEYI